MASSPAIRAVWVAELYQPETTSCWCIDVVLAKRFLPVEASLRQRAARYPGAFAYTPLHSVTDLQVVAAFAANEGLPTQDHPRPFRGEEAEIVRGSGALVTLRLAVDSGPCDLLATVTAFPLPACDCNNTLSTVKFGTSAMSPSPARGRPVPRLLVVITAPAVLPPRDGSGAPLPAGSGLTRMVGYDEIECDAAEAQHAVLSLLSPLLPPAPGKTSPYDILHRDLMRRTKRGCHVDPLKVTAPAPSAASTPWQQTARALIVGRMPHGRPTTAEPHRLPTLAELLRDGHADVTELTTLAQRVDAQFDPVAPPSPDHSANLTAFASIVTVDLVCSAQYGRSDASDATHVGTHIYVDLASFDEFWSRPERRMVLSSGRWGCRPGADASGLLPRTISCVEINPALVEQPRSVLLRRAPELLPERLPSDSPVYSVPSKRGIEALSVRLSTTPWYRQSATSRRVPTGNVPLDATSDMQERVAALFTVDVASKSLSTSARKVAVGMPAAAPAKFASVAVDLSVVPPFATTLKVTPSKMDQAGEEHTVAFAATLQLDASAEIRSAFQGGTTGAGSVAEFRSTSAFGADPMRRATVVEQPSGSRSVIVAHLAAVLRVHDPGVDVLRAQLKPSVGTAELQPDGTVRWVFPPWTRRAAVGFELRLNGTIFVSRSGASPTTAMSPLRACVELDFVLIPIAENGAVDVTDASPISTVELVPATCLRAHGMCPPLGREERDEGATAKQAGTQRQTVPPALAQGLTVSAAMAPVLTYAAFIDNCPMVRGTDGIVTPVAETVAAEHTVRKLRAIASLPPSSPDSGGGFTVWNAMHAKCRAL
jgi:hypothetical protein